MTGAAQHRQDPARLGGVLAADRNGEPDTVLEVVAGLLVAFTLAFERSGIDQFFGCGLIGKMLAHESDGNLFGAVTGQNVPGKGLFDVIHWIAERRVRKQAFVITSENVLARRRRCPGGIDVGAP